MPSSFSPALRVELIADNEQAGGWGQTTNRNFTQVFEEAIAATTEIDVTATDVTLTTVNGGSDQSRRPYVRVIGAPVVARAVTAANANKNYFVSNTTDQDLTFKGVGQTGVTIPKGETAFVRLIEDNPAQIVHLAALGGPANFTRIELTGATDDALIFANQTGDGPVAQLQVNGIDVLTVDDEMTSFAGPVEFPAVAGGGFLPLAGGVLSGALREDRVGSAEILLNVSDALADHRASMWLAKSSGEMLFGYINDIQLAWLGGVLVKPDYKVYDIATGRPFTIERADGGYLPLTGGQLTGPLVLRAPTNATHTELWFRDETARNRGLVYWERGSDSMWLAHYAANGTQWDTTLRLGSDGFYCNGNLVWHAGNDGPGSGLEADLLDGYHADVNPVGSRIVVRDGSANISAALLYSNEAGGAGNIRGYGGNSFCFRWDGSNAFYRVDNAVERKILSDIETSSGFGVYNGWARLPGGLIVQWLRVGINDDGLSNYTLPIAFPGDIGNCTITCDPGVPITGNSLISAHGGIRSRSTVAMGVCANFVVTGVLTSCVTVGW